MGQTGKRSLGKLMQILIPLWLLAAFVAVVVGVVGLMDRHDIGIDSIMTVFLVLGFGPVFLIVMAVRLRRDQDRLTADRRLFPLHGRGRICGIIRQG